MRALIRQCQTLSRTAQVCVTHNSLIRGSCVVFLLFCWEIQRIDGHRAQYPACAEQLEQNVSEQGVALVMLA